MAPNGQLSLLNPLKVSIPFSGGMSPVLSTPGKQMISGNGYHLMDGGIQDLLNLMRQNPPSGSMLIKTESLVHLKILMPKVTSTLPPTPQAISLPQALPSNKETVLRFIQASMAPNGQLSLLKPLMVSIPFSGGMSPVLSTPGKQMINGNGHHGIQNL